VTAPFDLTGQLPRGVTVLEASAGTGKTYTIAALAARYVAEGTPLEHLLLVTFTRLATGELRERVRERLVAVERGLAEPAGSEDEVVRLLAGGDVPLARQRLARAIEGFDGATIATIHEFCGEVLGGLGIQGDVDRRSTLIEDPRELIEQVVDDLYAQRFALREDPPAFSRADAGRIAALAIANPTAPIEPDGGGTTPAAMRARFAARVREELDVRKRRLGLLTFDDLLVRLCDALTGSGSAEVAARLRDRYRVVLVDEFQDTDPVQWEIMETAFGHPEGALVLIGDPKQAIYSFRGADVYAYLRARHLAGTEATLATNWRSDADLLRAYDALFDGARLGHPGIAYRQVQAARPARRLSGAPVPEALRVRLVDAAQPGLRLTGRGLPTAETAREHIAADLAADVVRLLRSGARVDGEPTRPGHLAVLVRRNKTAEQIQAALGAVGVPAVINGAGSVFGTPAAGEWVRLLEALERPASQARARSAALTDFLGWDAERVARADDDEWEDVYRRLHEWAGVLRDRGVASLVEAVTLGERLPERVLRRLEGERTLTDLRHVGELLHAAASAEQLGVAALGAWLRRRVQEAAAGEMDEERTRRLESDAQAVQVLTIHRAKGLEFGVVYCPDLWEPGFLTDQKHPLDFHDPAHSDERRIDVAAAGRDHQRHWEQHRAETRGEDLRIAYVALTRAKHQAVVWWAGTTKSKESALGRLLFARDEDGTIRTAAPATPSDADARARFTEVAAQASGCVSVEASVLRPGGTWSPPQEPVDLLAAATWDRELDRRWRRTSYSDITAVAHEARVGSEPEEPAVADEPEAASPVAAGAGAGDGDDALRAIPSRLSAMPMGVAVGTLVHRVFETTDFAAADLEGEIAARVGEAVAWRPVELGDPATVAEGLAAAIATPTGAGFALRDVPRAARLDELGFELPLAGGDAPLGDVTLAGIAAALRAHLPAGDPLAGYADRLADPGLRSAVRGYLTGSLDLVVRAGGGRWWVVDYKTNWLGEPDEPLTAWHYRPAALALEMERRHYGLQAILYAVALHRYLRWRLPGYDAARDFGGVLYLFVRGMSGPGTPQAGVFAWHPPAALLDALSAVVEGRG
jgi:exodeoxyribonuclease V beta subunit